MTWPLPPGRRARGLAELFGYVTGRHVVVVTERGTELPISAASGWGVLELSRLLGEIDALPECAEPEVRT